MRSYVSKAYKMAISISVMIAFIAIFLILYRSVPVSEDTALLRISDYYHGKLPNEADTSRGDVQCSIIGRPPTPSYQRNGVWSGICSFRIENHDLFTAEVGVDEFGCSVLWERIGEWDADN